MFFLPTVSGEYVPLDVHAMLCDGMELVANSLQNFGSWGRRVRYETCFIRVLTYLDSLSRSRRLRMRSSCPRPLILWRTQRRAGICTFLRTKISERSISRVSRRKTRDELCLYLFNKPTIEATSMGLRYLDPGQHRSSYNYVQQTSDHNVLV